MPTQNQLSNMQLAFPKKSSASPGAFCKQRGRVGWWSGNKSNKAISLEQHQAWELKFLWTSEGHFETTHGLSCKLNAPFLSVLRGSSWNKSAQGMPNASTPRKKLSNLMDKSALSDRNHMKSGKINYKRTACIELGVTTQIKTLRFKSSTSFEESSVKSELFGWLELNLPRCEQIEICTPKRVSWCFFRFLLYRSHANS